MNLKVSWSVKGETIGCIISDDTHVYNSYVCLSSDTKYSKSHTVVENKSGGHDTRIDTFISYHIITYYPLNTSEALHTLKHTYTLNLS